MKDMQLFPRVLIALICVFTLLGGLGAGLARLGWQMDAISRNLVQIHGPLMICGFLGTLISLERAVGTTTFYRWSMIVPIINAAGTLALLLLGDAIPAKLLLTGGSLGLLALYGFLLALHPLRYMVIMTSGAICLLLGNLLWVAGQPIFQVVHLWTAFLLLTIVGERLELTRVRQLTPTIEFSLILAVALYLTGTLITIVNLAMGTRVLGGGALLMAVWLLRYDIARRTIRGSGLTRYIAACLLIGYVWLAVGGAIALWKGALYAGPDYSSMLHAFLLGFVFSMIFGHAPIILPALTGLRLDYRPIFYLPLLLLHSTLIYRIYGQMALDFEAIQWGGLLNVASILLFLTTMLYALLRSNSVPLVAAPAQP
jgi:hypothetical protein